jgi:short-subunit dehydrogenase
MSRFDGTVVVTGASSGIGLQMAKLIAPRAKTLILVARRTQRLEALRDELVAQYKELTVDVLTCDLSDRAAANALGEKLAAREGGIDVLVNNAGLGDMGLFERSSQDKTLFMLDVNVTSLLILTRALLPKMIERGKGGVLNISSGFGVGFLPSFASYVGTKYFVTGFTEALRAETRGTGIAVTQVCPGPVATEFEENVGNFTGRKVPSFIEIGASQCARAAVSGFERNAAIVFPGFFFKLVMLANALTPTFLYRPIAGLLGRVARKAQLTPASGARDAG